MSDDERFLITVPEAAAKLGIGITKAWEMARRGDLPGVVRLGTRSVRVDPQAVRRWLDEQASKPAA